MHNGWKPFLAVMLTASAAALAQDKTAPQVLPSGPPPVKLHADGAVELPAQTVPPSSFLSPEAKAYLLQHLPIGIGVIIVISRDLIVANSLNFGCGTDSIEYD